MSADQRVASATTRDEILDGVRQVLRTRLAVPGPVEPESRLGDDLRLDSLGLLTLVVELENHFRVCIDDGEEARIETVGDLLRVIEARLAAPGERHD